MIGVAMRIISVIIFLVLALPAWAVDFSTVIKGLDGQPIMVKEGTPLTLGEVAAGALLKDDPTLSGKEKVSRYVLAQKVYNAKDITLTLDEAKLIKEQIGKNWSPIIVGPAWFLIPDEVK